MPLVVDVGVYDVDVAATVAIVEDISVSSIVEAAVD